MGSWGLWWIRALHMVLWALIVTAFVLGVVGGCGMALAGTVEEWLDQPQADEQMRLLEALLRRAPSKARRIAV